MNENEMINETVDVETVTCEGEVVDTEEESTELVPVDEYDDESVSAGGIALLIVGTAGVAGYGAYKFGQKMFRLGKAKVQAARERRAKYKAFCEAEKSAESEGTAKSDASEESATPEQEVLDKTGQKIVLKGHLKKSK